MEINRGDRGEKIGDCWYYYEGRNYLLRQTNKHKWTFGKRQKPMEINRGDRGEKKCCYDQE